MPDIHRGSCLCGSVHYEVEGSPFTFFVCHCKNCQKASGSSFASNAFFKDTQYRLLKGKDKLRTYADTHTASGRALRRQFCTECGSTVGLIPETKGIYIVATGTLDDPAMWKPRKESFTDDKRPWIGEIGLEERTKSKLW